MVSVVLALAAVELLDAGKTLEEIAELYGVSTDALAEEVAGVRNIGQYKPQLIIRALGANVTLGRTELVPAIKQVYKRATEDDIEFALLGLRYIRMRREQRRG